MDLAHVYLNIEKKKHLRDGRYLRRVVAGLMPEATTRTAPRSPATLAH